MKILGVVLSLGLCFNLISYSAWAQEEGMRIKEGSKVSFEYTLTVDGEVTDTSQGRGPLEYTQGQEQIIPGLEKELKGMKVGDEKTVTIVAKDAYGLVNLQAFQEVLKSAMPQGIELKEGIQLQMQTAQGQTLPVKISEVKEDAVVIDLNHPLAGKDLTFKVKIVSIE